MRLGPRSSAVFHLVTEYGIEARIAALIANKKALFGGLFDGTTDAVRFDGKVSFLADVEKLVPHLPDVPAPHAEDDTTEDDAAEDHAAEDHAGLDTELQTIEPQTIEPDGGARAAVRAATPDESATDGAEKVADDAGNESAPESNERALGAGRAALPDATNMLQLLSRIRVQRTDAGGVRIEAPPEAAESLVTLLEGLARLVASEASLNPKAAPNTRT